MQMDAASQIPILFSSEILKRSELQIQFSRFLRNANRSNQDVNDWIEEKAHWPKALPILEKIVFPYIDTNSACCEIGAGTGRFARHLLAKIRKGSLHLVDRNVWVISFLSRYFGPHPRIKLYLNDGHSLKGIKSSSLDMMFSNGTFIELALGFFFLYSREFRRVLRRGAYCVLNYLDISTPEGWRHLKTNSAKQVGWFTYHNPEVIDRIFSSAGFQILRRHSHGCSTYLVARKRS